MSAEGSELHFVLGNHETRALQGDFSKFTEADLENFAKMGKIEELFSEKGIYGQWLSKKNTILKVGDYVFCHRGVGEWIHNFSPAQINSTVRAWINYWISGRNEPLKSMSWAVGKKNDYHKIPKGDGMFNASTLSPRAESDEDPGMMQKASLVRWLENITAKILFIAHYPVLSLVGPHPIYGDPVWLTDAGISKAVGGELAYLDLAPGEEAKTFVRATRPEGKHAFREAGCMKKIRQLLTAI
jgi:hypothetical protein